MNREFLIRKKTEQLALMHLTDCYFCMISTVEFFYKNRHAIQHPNVLSVLRPVPHNESLPLPVAPKTYTLQPEIYLEGFEPQPGPSTATDDDED